MLKKVSRDKNDVKIWQFHRKGKTKTRIPRKNSTHSIYASVSLLTCLKLRKHEEVFFCVEEEKIQLFQKSWPRINFRGTGFLALKFKLLICLLWAMTPLKIPNSRVTVFALTTGVLLVNTSLLVNRFNKGWGKAVTRFTGVWKAAWRNSQSNVCGYVFTPQV